MIELRNVHQNFGKTPVLGGVDLTISEGEHVLLTGPSGTGKSALLRIIAGLDAPTSGEVMLDGRCATKGDQIVLAPARRQLAMVFQDLGLWPDLSVLGNVLLGLASDAASRREKRERAEAAIKACQLTPLHRRKPRRLSGGEQQRLALARVFAMRPRILLLDEPFGALDLVLRHEVFQLIRGKAREEGITVLTVSHHPADAFGLAVDRIAVLEEGRIAECVTIDEMGRGRLTSATLQVWRRMMTQE